MTATSNKETILIVEDEFIVANDLRLMLNRAGYQVCGTGVITGGWLIEKTGRQYVILQDVALKRQSSPSKKEPFGKRRFSNTKTLKQIKFETYLIHLTNVLSPTTVNI